MGKKQIFLGFDFGTYSTKIAFYENDETPKILNVDGLSDDSGVVFSFISEDGSKLGYEAYKDYKKGKEGIHYGFKMNLDKKDDYERAKKFLNEVYNGAIKTIKDKGYNIGGVTFSVPNSWITEKNERFMKLLQDIGAIKDYKSIDERITVAEPYAAAMYHVYGEVEKAGKKALIIDAGAGTIDTIIIDIKGDGSIQDRKNTYETIEKAGRYVDEKIKAFYKLNTLKDAEELKFNVSYQFSKDDKAKAKVGDTLVKREELEGECLNEWVSEYTNLLNKYREYEPDYILFAGGFSAFYLIEKLAKKLFPDAELYPIKESIPFTSSRKEFKKDASIAFGCAIHATGKTEVKETLKFDLYLEVESITGVKTAYRGEEPVEVVNLGRGKYLVCLFDKNDLAGVSVSLQDIKIDGRTFAIKQYGVINIVQRYKNKEKRLKVSIDKFKGEEISNVIFTIDKNKILKLIYVYENGRTETLSELELKDMQGEK